MIAAGTYLVVTLLVLEDAKINPHVQVVVFVVIRVYLQMGYALI